MKPGTGSCQERACTTASAIERPRRAAWPQLLGRGLRIPACRGGGDGARPSAGGGGGGCGDRALLHFWRPPRKSPPTGRAPAEAHRRKHRAGDPAGPSPRDSGPIFPANLYRRRSGPPSPSANFSDAAVGDLFRRRRRGGSSPFFPLSATRGRLAVTDRPRRPRRPAAGRPRSGWPPPRSRGRRP